jgi:hypothetical protein
MSTAVLAACARALGEHLAEYGFKRDRRVFRRWNAAGDAIIIGFQTHPSFTDDTQFFVNVAFLLAPAWQWTQEEHHYPPSKQPGTADGNWFDRVNPTDWSDDGTFVEQWVVRDESEAPAAAERIFWRLRDRLEELSRWLDRDYLWQAAGNTDILGFAADSIKIFLLAEQGTSDELRELLFEGGEGDEADRSIWEFARRHEAAR